MSAKKRDISREEMRQYLEGKLKGNAAHEVERHLLENEFAHEAMGGFEGFDQELIDADIDHLKARVASKKRKGLYYYVAAAVALLIVSLSSVWFLMDQVNDDSTLTYEEQFNSDEDESGPEQTKQESVTVEEEVKVNEEDNESPIKREEKTVAIPKPTKTVESRSKKEVEQFIAEVRIEEDLDLEEEIDMEGEPVLAEVVVEEDAALPALETMTEDYLLDEELDADIVIDTNSLQDAIAGKVAGVVITGKRSKAEESMTNSAIEVEETEAKKSIMIRGLSSINSNNLAYVTGQITDDTGEPIPGVNVVIKGTATGTTSDIDGNYKIVRIPGMVLNFSFIGLASTDITVGDQPVINVEMESDVQALTEVVVIGYGAENDVEKSYQSAQPEIGMPEYKDYLERNLIYPEEAKERQIEGKVILKLTINSFGEIEEIDVKRNLGFGCDEEAIRLIKDGPKWLPAEKDGSNISSTVRVKVKFELED